MVVMCLSAGCNVRNIYFTNVQRGRRCGAFVELESEEDVKLALSHNNRYFKRSSVMGRYTATWNVPHMMKTAFNVDI